MSRCNKGRSTYASLLFTLVAASGCDYRTEKGVQTDQRPIQIDMRQISFRTVFDRVIDPKCVLCHGDQGGVRLETYEDVVARLDRIKVRVLLQRDMPKPPKPALTEAEMDLLAAWIQAGAPRDPVNPVPSPSPSPSPSPNPSPSPSPNPSPSPTPSPEPSWEPIVATFPGIQSRILGPRCSGCHNPNDETDFDTEQNLIDFGLIVPGDPSRSEIFKRVTLPPDDGDRMPPDGALSREEITAIHAWILHVKPVHGARR